MRRLALCSLVILCAVSGCVAARGHGVSGPESDGETETTVVAALTAASLPVAQYEQSPAYLRTMDLYATEFMYMGIYPGGTYTRTRCVDDGCSTRVGESGSYQLTRTRTTTYVRFLGPPATGSTTPVLRDRYAYEIDGTTVWLRRVGTSDWFPMQDAHGLWSESLCDSTRGSWTDDDAAPDGTFCVCGSGRVYTAEDGCTDVTH